MSEMRIPYHVGFIVDGNGRWAKERGLSRSLGHKAGSVNMEKLAYYMFDRGVKVLSVFLFSTENFKREKKEVDYLMKLFVSWFTKSLKNFMKNNVKVVFSGRREMLDESVQRVIENLEEKTKNNDKGILNCCMAYGGQYEIVDMTKRIAEEVKKGKIDVDSINPELVNKYLYNELPPIDLVIRTSGENRISNFMLWQSAYAEYYFPTTYFPDFKEKDFDLAIIEYNNRDRRFGGVKK